LQIILAIGNFMNDSSKVANTYGFKLKSLTKIKDTKSVDNKTTLMQYIVSYLEAEHPTLLDFLDELKNVDAATRVSYETIDMEMAKIRKGKELVQRELEQAIKANLKDDKFIDLCQKFSSKHFSEISIVEECYQDMVEDLKVVAELYAEDPNKLSKKPDEFFSDLRIFFADFQQAKTKNDEEKKKQQQQQAKSPVTTKGSTATPTSPNNDDPQEKLSMLLDPSAILQRREAMKNKRKTQSKSHSICSITLY
jgi:hypothetical protein